jgi:hypothetical protein
MLARAPWSQSDFTGYYHYTISRELNYKNTQYNLYYRKKKPLSRAPFYLPFYYLFTQSLVFTTKITTQK